MTFDALILSTIGVFISNLCGCTCIGLLDVDVYGPSLPVLVNPDDPAVRQSSIGPGVVKPIEHKGVKMLSLGFVSPTVSTSFVFDFSCNPYTHSFDQL